MNWEKDEVFLSKWLNNELSTEEKSAFEATEDGKEFVRLMNASTLIESVPYDVDAAFSKLNQSIQNSPQPRQKVVWMQPSFIAGVAAAVALLVATIYIFSDGVTTIQTGFSEQEIVLLPDGSEAKLNASSSLEFQESTWEKERNLVLSGEAFFEVEKGMTFKVETENGAVQVLGTSFNVRSRGDRLEVTCYTGRVEVSASSVNKELTPGDIIRIAGGEMIAFRQDSLATQPSWMDGVVSLRNAPLPEVLNELRYVFGCEITYDGSLDKLLYTGAFPNRSAQSAMKLVFEPLAIDYTYNQSTNELIIFGLE